MCDKSGFGCGKSGSCGGGTCGKRNLNLPVTGKWQTVISQEEETKPMKDLESQDLS